MKDGQLAGKELLSLCAQIYGPGKIAEEAISVGRDGGQIIEFCRRNRLAHYLALKSGNSLATDKNWNETRNALISEYDDYRKNLTAALREVKEILGEEPFIVIKTFSAFPHPTYDLDVVVKDEETAGRFAGKTSGKKRALPFDVNTGISWGGAEAVSSDFLWRNVQSFSFGEVDFLVPQPGLDALIRIGHVPFETAQIRLGELLHIYRQLAVSDAGILTKEARSMGWPKTFGSMIAILEALHRVLFKTPLFKERVLPAPSTPVNFPFRLSAGVLAQGIIEKKAWRKVPGARFIIKDWIGEWIDRRFRW